MARTNRGLFGQADAMVGNAHSYDMLYAGTAALPMCLLHMYDPVQEKGWELMQNKSPKVREARRGCSTKRYKTVISVGVGCAA